MPASLYYSPASCGAASFIAAHIAGTSLNLFQVDIPSHTYGEGKDFYQVNPKGNVPALVLEDGTLLNEGAAVLQWIADQNPGKVAPAYGTTDRYLVQNALNYVASEVHPSFGSFFYPLTDEERVKAQEKINSKLTYLNKFLEGKTFLVGNSFTIADSYLSVVLSWAPYLKQDLSSYPNIVAYEATVAAVPEVQAAKAAMGTNPSSF